jgi:mutator protein MutT
LEKGNKPHFHVSAGLIWRDGRLLIAKRPEGSHLAGFWEFPGGKQEKGETLKECLRREIREELGIEIKPQKRIFSIDYEYESKAISLHVFQCCLMSGNPEPLECASVKWVHPRDLVRYRFPPPDQAIIKFLRDCGEDYACGTPP